MLRESIMCCFPLVKKEVNIKKGKKEVKCGSKKHILQDTFWCSADSLSQMSNSTEATVILIKHHQPSVSGVGDNVLSIRISCA